MRIDFIFRNQYAIRDAQYRKEIERKVEVLDTILNFIQSIIWLLAIGAIAVGGYLYWRFRYKIANADEVLVITGGKGLKTYVAGGAFVGPRRKYQMFPLGVMTVSSDDQETHSSTLVPVTVVWTAQLRVDTSSPESLSNAVEGFSSYKNVSAIESSLKQTLDGEVRAVIATLTPEEVVRDKTKFKEDVENNVAQRMKELGFKLISLNISTVRDDHGHYENLAAEDREEKRKTAERLTADANKEVAVAQAAADEASAAAAQQRDLAIAEQQRDLQLRRSAIQVETDQAQADADVAGELRREERNKELAARRGEVQVIEEQQRNATARARREVELTDAETALKRTEIEAEARKRQDEINAEADAREAEIAADAAAKVAKLEAEGKAGAEIARAQGEADAMNRRAEAEADKTRKTGLAEADVRREQGLADADAIRARGEAEAEAQRLMAEALAANDEANLRVTLAEIERDTRITISTNLGQIMASMGENATFVDMGGSGSSGDGDLFSRVLGNLPELFAKLDVKSEALHGAPFGAMFGSTIKDVLGKGEASPETVPATVAESTPASLPAPSSNEEPEGEVDDPRDDVNAFDHVDPLVDAEFDGEDDNLG